MTGYDTLASVYDTLMTDVQYHKRADHLERLFKKSTIPVHTVLDLACGTGTMACLLSERGYQVTATDGSLEMLTEAMQKAASLTGQPPFFLHQAMPRLRLLEQVDTVISTVDSLNYLTRKGDVEETFRRVYQVLKPGGQFIFDVNSAYKLRRMNEGLWLDETENAYCVWRTAFSEKSRICTYWVDLFRLQRNGAWTRSVEEHRERAWEETELHAFLEAAGFGPVTVTGDLTQRPPKPDEDRLIFRCQKRA